jgi:hypothetical protein
MKLGLAETLRLASEKKGEERVEFLQKNDSPSLRRILQLCFNPEAPWALPEGNPPYKPLDLPDQQGRLYAELRRLYLFLEGGNNNLKPIRREFLYIQLLESIDPEDAELLLSIKEGRLPYKGMQESVVRKAFPDLLPDKEVKSNAKEEGKI